MDHLGLEKAAVLGTSRGGLIAMTMAATAPDRLMGAALNDVGPVLELPYLQFIAAYVGKNPATWKTLADAEAGLPLVMAGFANVPPEKWRDEARRSYRETAEGLEITYDPRLGEAVQLSPDTPLPDLWPLFVAVAQKPLCVIRGANSPLLSAATLAEMQARSPGMVTATVPDRGHVPFLDEPEATAALDAWLALMRQVGAQ